jgi:hypothetical protein
VSLRARALALFFRALLAADGEDVDSARRCPTSLPFTLSLPLALTLVLLVRHDPLLFCRSLSFTRHGT